MLRFAGAIAAAALAATSAQAATVFTLTTAGFNANNTGGCTNTPSGGGYSQCAGQEYTVDGIKLTVTAGMYTDTTNTGDSTVIEGQRDAEPRVYSNGTGLDHDGGDPGGLPNDGSHMADGHQGNEVFFLRFDRPVHLIAAAFSYVDSHDGFDVFNENGGADTLIRIAQDVDIPGSGFYGLADLTSFMLVGDLFGLGASHKKHDWKLKAIKVKEAPEIPVPAALPLFLAGIAGLSFASRKRKRR